MDGMQIPVRKIISLKRTLAIPMQYVFTPVKQFFFLKIIFRKIFRKPFVLGFLSTFEICSCLKTNIYKKLIPVIFFTALITYFYTGILK